MNACCDICARTAELALISSGCAPVTYAACAECREKRAESLEVAALWWLLEGGSEAATTHLARMTAWENGTYVGQDRILSYCEAHRDDLIAGMTEESDLVEDDVPLGEEDKIPWEARSLKDD